MCSIFVIKSCSKFSKSSWKKREIVIYLYSTSGEYRPIKIGRIDEISEC